MNGVVTRICLTVNIVGINTERLYIVSLSQGKNESFISKWLWYILLLRDMLKERLFRARVWWN